MMEHFNQHGAGYGMGNFRECASRFLRGTIYSHSLHRGIQFTEVA